MPVYVKNIAKCRHVATTDIAASDNSALLELVTPTRFVYIKKQNVKLSTSVDALF